MRLVSWLRGGLLLACLPTWVVGGEPPRDPDVGGSDATLGAEFRARVGPFLATHCNGCHGGAMPKSDLDLSVFQSVESVAGDLARWDLVLEQLEAGSMPPKKARSQPSQEERSFVMSWARRVRKSEATRRSGDPGPVLARRLSNAEYDNTVRDLTGVDIRPTREFPVDPANKAGFDNSSESLTMSPALVKKYLEAARKVAEHVVLAPDGLEFAPDPALADTDRDKYCVRRIIEFYKRQPTDHADYFLAAWRYQHRERLGRPGATLNELAVEAKISPRYLASVWSILNEPAAEVGPIAALRQLWRALPGDATSDLTAVKAGCARMREFVVELRQRLTPVVKNLTVRSMGAGSQPLVLWKNDQFAANRRRYADNAATIAPESLRSVALATARLALPADPARCAADWQRFCSTFPDAFLVSERARVFLDGKEDKNNVGRLLSAGFHSMTGFYRDDAPLYDLILDDQGRAEIDRLWTEFAMMSGTPARQYSSFLWFERAESRFVSGPEFDFVRAEDRDATTDAKIQKLVELYRAKALRNGASAVALKAIDDFFTTTTAQLRRVERLRLAAEPSHVRALQAFAERAYRRPLEPAERQDVADFHRLLRDRDELSHEDAVRDTIVRVLMSPNFCYRVDLPGEGRGTEVQPLTDHALASRLSYFLWSSMPDAELLAKAAAGELQKPEVLVAQAVRMLRDPKARALALEFGGNWLDFRRFEEHNSVDRGRFPSFSDELRRAMFEEPVRFLLDLIQRDGSVHELLDARHTFVNPSLARHYGMPGVAGGDATWVRIDDAVPYGRGGLLPMAVFLTKNAPGLRTSPVKRGYWVARRLLGEHIPAPPANVPELPADEAKLGELTLRATLARHRADKACAGCHERFDALGLAFEGYGPVGEHRDRDLGGRPVDATATFPGGFEGTGLEGLRTYLDQARRADFDDNLCRKLLAYALGRSLIPSDDDTIEAMKARLASDGFRFGSLFESVVTSRQFRYKRFDSERAE